MNIKTKLIALAKIVCVYVVYLLLGSLVMFLVSKVLPSLLTAEAISINGIIFGVVVALFTTGYHFLVLYIFGRKDKPKCGIEIDKGWFIKFISATGFAAACIAIIWLLAVIFHGFSVRINIINAEITSVIFLLFVRLLLTGFQEELITRGTLAYIGKNGGKWFSAIIIGLLFSFTHTGTMDVLFYLNLFLFSIVASQMTWITGNLWAAMGFHFSWNFVMGGVLGVPISGLNATGLLVSEVQDSKEIINGGTTGLEGSVFCLIVLITTIIILLNIERRKNIDIIKKDG
jgi:membrane protease YdiL (CAAX protease family)